MTLKWSSLAVRQALLTTSVVALAVIGFGIAVITLVDHRLHADLAHTIDTDVAGLSDIMATGGLAELQRRIADRTNFSETAASLAFYRLESPNGTVVAGNVAMRPGLDAKRSQISNVSVYGVPVLVRATALPGGVQLFVGRSLAPTGALLAQLWRIIAATALVAVALSLAIGLSFAGRFARRIEMLNMTFDSFDRGDMTARAALSGQDEINRLAAHVDSHLGKIEVLIHAQRQISDNVAHELRTPLLHLDARLLQALDSGPSPVVAAQLERARSDIRSVVSMFDALLDIALAESANGHDETARIDLSQIATDIAEMYAASAEDAGIDFSTRIAPNVAMTGDAMQMTRLIANLLDNALKYLRAGDRVRLTLAEGPCLIVEDDGPGIAAADHARVFQRFYRASPGGTSSLQNGHGLGLALVSVIAARHALVARVEDAGPGARFVVAPA